MNMNYSGVDNSKFNTLKKTAGGAADLAHVNEEINFHAREEVYSKRRDDLTIQFR